MKGFITTQILEEVDPRIALTIKEPVDPQAFFKTGEGIWISNDFTSRILGKAVQLEGPAKYTLESLELTQRATDSQIEESMGNKNVFKESDVCAIIAHLISEQPKGKEGALLHDGDWNLFYTPSFVVLVYWAGGAWRVVAWHRGGDAWRLGARVFSPQLKLDI